MPKAKKPVKKAAKSKPKAKKARKPAKKAARAGVARPERLDLRLSKAEKAKVLAKARKSRRTVTSVVAELIEKMR